MAPNSTLAAAELPVENLAALPRGRGFGLNLQYRIADEMSYVQRRPRSVVRIG